MPIQMPTYTQLSEEQRKILEDASFDETLMVTGPPGTGKTVIAMWQSKQMSAARDTPLSLIMYNRVLREYTSGWDQWDDTSVDVRTYHSWAARTWSLATDREDSRYPPQEPQWTYQWDQIGPVLLHAKDSDGDTMKFGHVVIDEAQDFSKGFYEQLGLLSTTGQVTVAVVADENQRLKDTENSSLEEIQDALAIGGRVQRFSLTKNYRNTLEIDALARAFYVGLATGQAAPPEDRRGSKPALISQSDGLEGMVASIARYARNNPSHSILVICPGKRPMNKIHHALDRELKGHHVAKYTRAGDESDLKTGEPKSVTLVTWGSMKGIESDAVFVPHLELFDLGQDTEKGELMCLYVMCSRARLKLELHYDARASDQRLVELVRERGADSIEEKSQ